MPATVDDHTVRHECLNRFCPTAELANGPGICFAACRFHGKEVASRIARVHLYHAGQCVNHRLNSMQSCPFRTRRRKEVFQSVVALQISHLSMLDGDGSHEGIGRRVIDGNRNYVHISHTDIV